MLKHICRFLLVCSFLLTSLATGSASESARPHTADQKAAILLVTFGTSVPSAQAAFANIEQEVRKAFPDNEIRWAYTSKIIRKKLAKEGKTLDSPEIALAKLMDEGYRRVAIQSLHMIPGQEFHETSANGRLFGQMNGGFERVQIAPPLLAGDEAMEQVLRIVATHIVPNERQANEAVVLMGHGTHHPSDAMYSALMYKAQRMDDNMYIGTVEGHPSFAEVKEALARKKITRAYLIPLMTVAGDHAQNDMAGDAPDSWKSQLQQIGIESVPVLKGLAEFNPIVALWIDNLKIALEQVNR